MHYMKCSVIIKVPFLWVIWFLQVNHHPLSSYSADLKNVWSLPVLNVPIHTCGKYLTFDYGGGVRLRLLKLQPVLGPFSITADGWWMDMQHWWDGKWGKGDVLHKTYHIASLPTTNPTWTSLRENLCLHGEKLMIKYFGCGVALPHA
jgi:hypothetical protein